MLPDSIQKDLCVSYRPLVGFIVSLDAGPIAQREAPAMVMRCARGTQVDANAWRDSREMGLGVGSSVR